jgi:hypothetical protein
MRFMPVNDASKKKKTSPNIPPDSLQTGSSDGAGNN